MKTRSLLLWNSKVERPTENGVSFNNGHTRFIDAQTGTDLGHKFSNWVKHSHNMQVMRVDDKTLNPDKMKKMTTVAKRNRDKNPYFVEWGEEV